MRRIRSWSKSTKPINACKNSHCLPIKAILLTIWSFSAEYQLSLYCRQLAKTHAIYARLEIQASQVGDTGICNKHTKSYTFPIWQRYKTCPFNVSQSWKLCSQYFVMRGQRDRDAPGKVTKIRRGRFSESIPKRWTLRARIIKTIEQITLNKLLRTISYEMIR